MTALESLAKARTLLPSGLATTVCALGALMVAERPPAERFNTSTAPGAAPFCGAVGTAANALPVGSATMLVVGPVSWMPPVRARVFALTTSTLLVTESNAGTVGRLGLIAIRPGEVPA